MTGRDPGISRRDLLRRGGAIGAGAVAVSYGGAPAPRAAAASAPPQEREYWIAAVDRAWDTSPTRHDDWRDEKVESFRFRALNYVAMTPGFKAPVRRGPVGDNRGMPGPVLRAYPGDTLVVHFRNLDTKFKRPHTMHPHGVHYDPRFDGTAMGRYTPPGGAVKFGRTFTYRWQVEEDSVGIWPYHDHGPFEMESTEAGLFGAIVIRPRDEPKPDVEHTLYFHQFNPDTLGAPMSVSAINGRAHAGNTPTLTARAGQDVAFNVLTLGSEFHTFHIHGHRWQSPAKTSVDSPLFGPSEGLRARFTEDAPGRWIYHCHVQEHMHHGMVGYYVVTP